MFKTCTRCEEPRDLEKEFYDQKHSSDGKDYRCIYCCREIAAIQREKNRKKQEYLTKTRGQKRCCIKNCYKVSVSSIGLCQDHLKHSSTLGKVVRLISGENPIYIYHDIAAIGLLNRKKERFLGKIDIEDARKVKDLYWHLSENGISASVGKRTIKLRRFLLDYTGSRQVIHLNHDILDYQKENLLIATRQEACFRNSKPKSNTSGIRGVSWDKKSKKWFVYLTLDGQRFSGGYHHELDKAEKARRRLEKEHWGI